jgi:DMSO/TMAO reductase YedYZ molybdopterin-dependent catalytic subunit
MRARLLCFPSIPTVLVVVALAWLALGCGGGAGGPVYAEGEATEFEGVMLTPIREQGNNALKGTQSIDRQAYKLVVDGLVETPLSLSYADLEAYEQVSWLMDLNCVEGWSFTAKWTGPELAAILTDAGVRPEAVVVIFHTVDVPEGYTSLPLEYITENGIILALKLNDLTLAEERGFPFQVVAKSKYGYKWAKWVTRIELSSDADFRGYWERGGYSNDADVGGPAFE